MYSSILLAALLPLAFAAESDTGTFSSDWITGLNDAQTSAYNAYVDALTDVTPSWSFTPTAHSAATALASQYYSDLDAWDSSVQDALQSQVTGTKKIDLPAVPTEFPGNQAEYYSSVYVHEASLLRAGQTTMPTETNTGSAAASAAKQTKTGNAAPMETGYAKMAGAMAAGVLGVAAVL